MEGLVVLYSGLTIGWELDDDELIKRYRVGLRQRNMNS